MEDFSKLLESYRKFSGLSQSELARRAGISASYVNRLEKDERLPPSRRVVLSIAEVLDLDAAATDALLIAAGYAPETPISLPIEHPVFRLVADILQDDRVPDEEVELLRRQMELIKRRWHSADEDPAIADDGVTAYRIRREG